jgi:hypothetical protein
MALLATEVWRGGFVVDKNTGRLIVTTDASNATMTGGFLRDPDGRAVVINV